MSGDRIIKVRVGGVVWVPSYFEQLTPLILTSYNDGIVWPTHYSERTPIETGSFDIGGGLVVEVHPGDRPVRSPKRSHYGAKIALEQATYVLDRWRSGKVSDMVELIREAFTVYGNGRLLKTVPPNL